MEGNRGFLVRLRLETTRAAPGDDRSNGKSFHWSCDTLSQSDEQNVYLRPSCDSWSSPTIVRASLGDEDAGAGAGAVAH